LHGGLSSPLSLGLPVGRSLIRSWAGARIRVPYPRLIVFPVSLYITGTPLIAIAVPFY
jgi:hypothetical protein